MGKYTPLKEYLLGQGKDVVPMTFAEIESVLNAMLPASKRYPAWWSNNEFNNTMTSEWLAAGYQTEGVDIASEKLVFKKIVKAQDEVPAKGKPKKWEDVYGFMQGKITLAEDFDPAACIDIDWPEPYTGLEENR